MIYQSKLTRKGQSTFPVALRKRLGLKVGQYLNYALNETTNKVEIEPETDLADLQGVFKTNIKWNKKAAQKAVEAYKLKEWEAKMRRSS